MDSDIHTDEALEFHSEIHNFISRIISGEYDGALKEIMRAIDTRNENRKAAVRELVHEVFGDDYDVTNRKPNPFIARSNRQVTMTNSSNTEEDDDATQESLPEPDDAPDIDTPVGRGGAIIGGFSGQDFER